MTASFRTAVVLFGPKGQGSFNESGLRGANQARAAGFDVDVHWIAPLSAQERAHDMLHLCDKTYDLIVAHGGQGDGPVALLAAQYPGQAFVVTQGSHQAANVARYEVLQEQSAFLAGVLAAHTTQTGAVGHFSGEKVPPGLRGRAAFSNGLHAAGFAGHFATQFCGHQHRPDWARQCVSEMAQQTRIDTLFAMIDGGRPGVTAACRQHGIQQIGNVLDWVERDPQVFIASAICDSGAAIHAAIKDFAQLTLPLGGYRAFGLESPELVQLVYSPRVPYSAKAAVDGFATRILRGEIDTLQPYDGPEHPLPEVNATHDEATPTS